MSDERETYAIARDDAVDMFGSHLIVTNALTGRHLAILSSGAEIVLDEPLCHGCDAPIADGPCGCMREAG